jgi:hypothetical protein
MAIAWGWDPRRPSHQICWGQRRAAATRVVLALYTELLEVASSGRRGPRIQRERLIPMSSDLARD